MRKVKLMTHIQTNPYPNETAILESHITSNWLRKQTESLAGMRRDDLMGLLDDVKQLQSAIECRVGIANAELKLIPIDSQPKEDYKNAYQFLVTDIERTEKCLNIVGGSMIEKLTFSEQSELEVEYWALSNRYAEFLVQNGYAESVEAYLNDCKRYLDPNLCPDID